MTTIKTKLFDDLQIGDMVWAQMPLSDEKLMCIDESYRIKPYLVVGKDDNGIYAFQSSHIRITKMNNFQIYGVDMSKFGYEKNSWIQLVNIKKIPIENLKSKMVHLSDYDLSMIQKRLKIQQNRGKPTSSDFNIPIKICEGDVIQYLTAQKMLLYVHAVDNGKFICYPISFQYRKNWIKIKINKKLFFIDFNNQITVADVNNTLIVDIANNIEINAIERKKEERNSCKNPKKKVAEQYKIGTIFDTEQGKMMYLYEAGGIHYGVNLIANKIDPNINPIIDIDVCERGEVYDSAKVKEVVEFLYNYLEKPDQKLNSIYMKMI